MLTTFVIVLIGKSWESWWLMTQAPCTILWLKQRSWAFSLACRIKEILHGVRTFSCLYLAHWLLCKFCPFLALVIQEYIEEGLGLEVSHERDNSIVKQHSFCSAEFVPLTKSRFGQMRKTLWEWAWPCKLLIMPFTSKVTAEFKTLKHW